MGWGGKGSGGKGRGDPEKKKRSNDVELQEGDQSLVLG